MKVTMYALLFMIVLNASVVIYRGAGIDSMPITPTEGEYDVNGTWRSYDAEDSQFYDVGTGFLFQGNFFLPYIEAFPQQLSYLGTPDFILDPLTWLWRLIWINIRAWLFSEKLQSFSGQLKGVSVQNVSREE